MELTVYNTSGQKTDRTVELSDAIYGIDPNDHAIYLDVKLILARKRQGTHKTKARSEVTGSTRKIKRQKGTGTARAGSIKSPIFRGGGRAFGPIPKDYGFKLNKKVRRLARKSALSYKAGSENITVVEDFNFDAPKTREFLQLLKSFDLADKKVLLIMPETKQNVYLSARNLSKVKYVNSNNLNTYDVLNANQILMAESSVKDIDELFKN